MKVIRLFRQWGLGYSSSSSDSKLEAHYFEEWYQKCIRYLSDAEGFITVAATGLVAPVNFLDPTKQLPVPRAKWPMQFDAQDVLQRLDVTKARITSLFGRVLKLDSSKKVVKKLAGWSFQKWKF